MDEQIGTAVEGPYGRADPVEILPQPHPTLVGYLITAPQYHPIWTQYFLGLISLADIDGWPEANVKFEGATHELLVVALDPERGQISPDDFTKPGFQLRQLRPTNIAEQFEATDDEMRQVTWLAARAVVHGLLNPETADAPTRIREQWLSAVVKTLAHIRGEEHAP